MAFDGPEDKACSGDLWREKIQLFFDAKVFGFTVIPFNKYNGDTLEVDRDFLKSDVVTKVPLAEVYDLVVFAVPKKYWKSPGLNGIRGFTDLGISYISVGGMDEFDDAWFGPEDARQKENAFAHFLFHELAHYFRYLKYGADVKICGYDSMENCEDPTHYDIAHGKIKELVDSLPLPAPRTAEEEQGYWLTWVLNLIKRVFLVNKIKAPEIEATIEDGYFLHASGAS